MRQMARSTPTSIDVDDAERRLPEGGMSARRLFFAHPLIGGSRIRLHFEPFNNVDLHQIREQLRAYAELQVGTV